EEHVRVGRVHGDIGDAGVFANGEHSVPGLAGVAGFVKAAFATGSPKRALRSGVNDIAVARIDKDAADVFRFLQAHVFPGLAAIVRAIDSIAIGDAALRVAFARADPHHVGLLRVNDHRANGIRAFVLENRLKGGAVVVRAPDAAASHAHEKLTFVERIDRDSNDATGNQSRADVAKLHPVEGIAGK